MDTLLAGQRWISETEPELGLGSLVEITDRTIVIKFDSSDCIRQYTHASSPIKRIIFKVGDKVQLKDNTWMTIKTVAESDGLVYYFDAVQTVCETDLADTISFSMPQDRLFAGITDTNKLFNLRYRLLKSKAEYDASPAKGFLGGQVELIPHQFFIADAVTSRYIPRVLLSDETGLGKTIEACLILHKLLMTHRAERILIVVPESLSHQWFIELYRKFNLSFMIFTLEYCSELELQDLAINPFLEHQLGIISLDDLKNNKRQRQIKEAGWDMIVIDEAHHITDDNQTYLFIQTLSKKVFGLILLTATPEQMGVRNHFLHLQLLDPERYFDFDEYLKETNQYKKILEKVRDRIKKKKSIDHILDSYGPGRVIFRNKRKVIKGFPKRTAKLVPLVGSQFQIQAINDEFFELKIIKSNTYNKDPRTLFLVDLIKQKSKILVICSSKEKVESLSNAIATHTSVDIATFDETMSLLQRDRSAAWFAQENGAKVLICSEIGSEGRNFQFVHNLFLFDLPQNPELLEQRIGRIDRIGQKKDIRIHVPFILGTAYEALAKWYMNGLNLFEKNIDGVHLIHKEFAPDLQDLFSYAKENNAIDETTIQKLVKDTKAFCKKTEKALAQGKNILLEMNSYKSVDAKKTIHHITLAEKNNQLKKHLHLTLDHYGIDTDYINNVIFKLKPNQMTDENFPSLSRKATPMTFSRQTAVVRDDVDFISWDHPFVQQTIEYFITNSTGSCTTALLNKGHQGLLLETIFILECVAPQHLNLELYLQAFPIRIVVDHEGKDVTMENKFKSFAKQLSEDNCSWFRDMEQVKEMLIPSMIDKSQRIAESRTSPLLQKGKTRIKDILGKEITRLTQLKKINPGIKDQEIELAKTKMDSLLDYLSSARLRLDALRLIRLQ